jgi:hypothetical protein
MSCCGPTLGNGLGPLQSPLSRDKRSCPEAAPASTSVEEKEEKKRDAGQTTLREILETIALFLVAFIVSRLTIGNYTILGQSMEPNYHENQRLLVDNVALRL